jgi:hypothetical protein
VGHQARLRNKDLVLRHFAAPGITFDLSMSLQTTERSNIVKASTVMIRYAGGTAYLGTLNSEQRRAVEHGVTELDCTPGDPQDQLQ